MIETYDEKEIKYKLDPKKITIPNFDPTPIKVETETKMNDSNNDINKSFAVLEAFDKNEHIKEKNEKLDELYNFVFKKEDTQPIQSDGEKMGLTKITEIKEYNNDQVIDKDELFDGVKGYTSESIFSKY